MAAAESPRIAAAHAALSGELRLFLAQLEPLWSVERMAADHAALVRGLERDGPTVLREHLGESAAALVAAEKRDTGAGGPCRRPVHPIEEGSRRSVGRLAERLLIGFPPSGSKTRPVSFRTGTVRRSGGTVVILVAFNSTEENR